MTIEEGFKRIFENAFTDVNSEIKDCKHIISLNVIEDLIDYCFIIAMINWFDTNYGYDVLDMYFDYRKKCYNSVNDRFAQFFNE